MRRQVIIWTNAGLLVSPAIARWQCFHPVYLFVCVCLCLSRCLSGRFNYEGLVPHKQYIYIYIIGQSFYLNQWSLSEPVVGHCLCWGHYDVPPKWVTFGDPRVPTYGYTFRKTIWVICSMKFDRTKSTYGSFHTFQRHSSITQSKTPGQDECQNVKNMPMQHPFTPYCHVYGIIEGDNLTFNLLTGNLCNSQIW